MIIDNQTIKHTYTIRFTPPRKNKFRRTLVDAPSVECLRELKIVSSQKKFHVDHHHWKQPSSTQKTYSSDECNGAVHLGSS